MYAHINVHEHTHMYTYDYRKYYIMKNLLVTGAILTTYMIRLHSFATFIPP